MRVLITGATGILGTELGPALKRLSDTKVVRTSRRGNADGSVVAWDLRSPAPPDIRQGSFDVIVHSAADTRWNLSPDDAWASNVVTTERVLNLATSSTTILYLSTAFVTMRTGTIDSDRLQDYNNTYEWSKAAAERRINAANCRTEVIRPPLVIGRRSDGVVARFTGPYLMVKAMMTGSAPAFVGDPLTTVEMVSVDDVVAAVLELLAPLGSEGIQSDPGSLSAKQPVVLGSGPTAISTGEMISLGIGAINAWRRERGLFPVDPPALIPQERWDRFFRPFVDSELSYTQRRSMELLSEFTPYISRRVLLEPTHQIPDVRTCFTKCITYWADRNAHVAGSTQRAVGRPTSDREEVAVA